KGVNRMGFIRYDHGAIQVGFESLVKFVNDMDDKLSDIESACAPIVESWESEQAREAYDTKKSQWNQAAQNIRDTIVNVGNALDNSNQEMRATDQRGAQLFG